MTTTSDEELAALAAATGDRDAFGELVRRHQAVVRRMLIRMTGGDRAFADDVAQDAFIRAFRRMSTYQARGSFKSWVCRIAYTEFLQAARKRTSIGRTIEAARSEAETDLRATGGPDGGAGVDLDRALGELNAAERDAVILCFACGFSHAEAAEALSVPVGTVKSRVARGRAKLRSYFSLPETVCA